MSPQRVYLPGRDVAHLIDGHTSLNTSPYALAFCRVAPTWGLSEWFGTGSQREYDEAERRRLCTRCAKKAGWLPLTGGSAPNPPEATATNAPSFASCEPLCIRSEHTESCVRNREQP